MSNKVGIVLLNWNGKRHLQRCLPSIKRSGFPMRNILLVNNGSTDASAEYISKNFPEVKVIELKQNVGYAMGNNIGAKKIDAEYIVFLNNDTVVTKDFWKPLINELTKNKDIGIVQPQIRSLDNAKIIDSVCSYLTHTGFLYHYGFLKKVKDKKYNHSLFAYSIKGACFAMRKREFLRLGGFDSDFVCYVEETDLCHRVWLTGKKVKYLPDSVIYHEGGGDMKVMVTNELTIYRSFKNRIVSYLKNLSVRSLFVLLPVHLLFCEIFVLASLLHLQFRRAFAAQLATIIWLFELPYILRKRKYIQKTLRKVKDSDINGFIIKNPRLSYYFYLFSGLRNYKDNPL